ncbi:Coatomer subunit zeta-1 [Hibiscus syriacus]|uniref:Coatomer subunit zeta n=1 Tax=Hibiscus syriacus TaxID=106335 RepID=A0A6A2Y6C9_HIBSY|nr:Coatomer subunit zeta-1 [Hibiscus syriacus]
MFPIDDSHRKVAAISVPTVFAWKEPAGAAHVAVMMLVVAELCTLIKNILLLDSEGKRVAVKYYSDDWPTNSAKEAFEKTVFTKTQTTSAQGLSKDLAFELCSMLVNEEKKILDWVFFDAVGLILRGAVDKREVLENLDLIFLCLDEIVDGGIVLEIDANVNTGKVASHSMDDGAPLSEQMLRYIGVIEMSSLSAEIRDAILEPMLVTE